MRGKPPGFILHLTIWLSKLEYLFVFLSPFTADAVVEHSQADQYYRCETEDEYHECWPGNWLALQISAVPVHRASTPPTLTLPDDAGKIPSEPGSTGADVKLVVLAEKIPVQPAAVIRVPTQHSVLHPPGIPVIKPPPSKMAPQEELTSRLRNLESDMDQKFWQGFKLTNQPDRFHRPMLVSLYF